MTTHTFSRDVLEEALADLNSIKKDGPHDLISGICFNIGRGPANGYEIVNQYSKGWSEYSGDEIYPVPSFINSDDAWAMYHASRDKPHYDGLWSKDTEYGQARWRLVDYLIERITADLQSMAE